MQPACPRQAHSVQQSQQTRPGNGMTFGPHIMMRPQPSSPHTISPHVHHHHLHPSQPPAGYTYGKVFRVNFWVKMTTALGVTQLTVGMCCMALYLVAYVTDHRSGHLVRYVGVGLATGTVIFSAGSVALLVVKRKTKFLITCFLLLSILAVLFALFPLVLGIVGASNAQLEDEEGLLMPICQLVFATVEIVVAAWSIGVCCQALCCPNTSFGHMNTRNPAGMGITQFIATGDGHHMIVFSSPAGQPNVVYNSAHQPTPVILQNGIATMPLTAQPGMACNAGHHQPFHQGAPPPVGGITYIPQHSPEGAAISRQEDGVGVVEKGGLLNTSEPVEREQQVEALDGQDRSYEIEDENVHLLC